MMPSDKRKELSCLLPLAAWLKLSAQAEMGSWLRKAHQGVGNPLAGCKRAVAGNVSGRALATPLQKRRAQLCKAHHLSAESSPTGAGRPACAGWRSKPPASVSGAKGDPLANNARPPVPASASRNVHSAFEVGLLSGKMMGRAFSSAIACAQQGVGMRGLAAAYVPA